MLTRFEDTLSRELCIGIHICIVSVALFLRLHIPDLHRLLLVAVEYNSVHVHLFPCTW